MAKGSKLVFSTTVRSSSDIGLRLAVAGAVTGPATVLLRKQIVSVIVLNLPPLLVVDLHHAAELSLAGVNTLLTGYTTAIDWGTSYQVLHARGSVLDILHDTGTSDILADSDDLGALLEAVLFLPVEGPLG